MIQKAIQKIDEEMKSDSPMVMILGECVKSELLTSDSNALKILAPNTDLKTFTERLSDIANMINGAVKHKDKPSDKKTAEKSAEKFIEKANALGRQIISLIKKGSEPQKSEIANKVGDYVSEDMLGELLTFDELTEMVGQLVVADYSTESKNWYKLVKIQEFVSDDSENRTLIISNGPKKTDTGNIGEWAFNVTGTHILGGKEVPKARRVWRLKQESDFQCDEAENDENLIICGLVLGVIKANEGNKTNGICLTSEIIIPLLHIYYDIPLEIKTESAPKRRRFNSVSLD